MNRKFNKTAFVFCNFINVCAVTFAQFNASLVNKSIYLPKKQNKKKPYWPQTFGMVDIPANFVLNLVASLVFLLNLKCLEKKITLIICFNS